MRCVNALIKVFPFRISEFPFFIFQSLYLPGRIALIGRDGNQVESGEDNKLDGGKYLPDPFLFHG